MKPYDMTTWVILLTYLACIAVISRVGLFTWSERINVELVMYLLSIWLEQPISREDILRTVESAKKLGMTIPLCFGTSMLVIVVVANGCKGIRHDVFINDKRGAGKVARKSAGIGE